MRTIFRNAKIFAGLPDADSSEADCMVIDGDTVAYIGQQKAISSDLLSESQDVRNIDLHGQHVLPSFIDSHVHLLLFGISLSKVDLISCNSLVDIRATISSAAKERPNAVRLLCQGWKQSVTGNDVRASMLDDLDERPIYIDSHDYHSEWCNSAALKELDVADVEDPPGGKIHRLPDGTPSGLIEESAVVTIVWPRLIGALSTEEKKAALRKAMRVYNESGYTSVVDMAMDEENWNLLRDLRDDGELSLRIAAHWLIVPSDSAEAEAAQVDRAIELHQQFKIGNNPDFWIAGIKIICDGVVDGCTAALSKPYLSTGEFVDPMWTSERLQLVLHQADAAGLQCALHAIGDAAVRLAVDGLASLGTKGHRHRIEHLELTRPEDAKRLGELGITASIQPVHCDPEQNTIWPPLIGHDACKRAFAYREFLDHGARIAIGTDAPTAPHIPFNNLFNASTRRSFRRPDDPAQMNPQFAIKLNDALSSTSYWGAFACFAENFIGGLKEGKKADFIMVNQMDDILTEPTSILKCKVIETWLGGKQM